MNAHRNPPMPARQMRQYTAGDLDEMTAAIAAADITWSAELGDPPSEPRYIQALAGGAMRALPNLEGSRDAELDRLRAVAEAAEKWRRAPIRGSRRAAARNRLHAALDALVRAHEDGGQDR